MDINARVVEKTYKSGEKIELADVEENQMLINKALSNNFKLNQSLEENKWSLLQFIKK